MRYAGVSDGLHSPEEFSAFVDAQREGLQTAFYDKNVTFFRGTLQLLSYRV